MWFFMSKKMFLEETLAIILRLQIYRGEQLLQYVVGFPAPGLFEGFLYAEKMARFCWDQFHYWEGTHDMFVTSRNWSEGSFGTTCDLATVDIQIICIRQGLLNSKVESLLGCEGMSKEWWNDMEWPCSRAIQSMHDKEFSATGRLHLAFAANRTLGWSIVIADSHNES